MKWLCYFILFLDLIAKASCPPISIIQAQSFTSAPKKLKWHDYLFIEIEGGTQLVAGDRWQISAWYAPVDINKNIIDPACMVKILREVNAAKNSIFPKTREPIPDKDFIARCYYKSAKPNILFVATAKTT